MREVRTRDDDARQASAADWLVRLQARDLDEADTLAFDAWLAADPANAAAYDRTLSTLLEVEAAAPQIARALTAEPARRPSQPRSPTWRRGWLVAGGLAAAATVVIALTPLSLFAPATSRVFATARGEHRTVRLADGSTVELDAATRISVTLGRHERRVVMPEGEAVFDVAADPARPFLIAAGDRTVRVVGTRFDVRRRDRRLSVTVERGVVEVGPTEAAGRAFRLHPGQRLDHLEGAPGVELSAADPQQVTSWRTGRLIYRDRPLAEVVADLNRQFATPIRLADPSLGQTRVSGVLVLDDEAAVIRRLALLAPIRALPSPEGIVLRSDPAAKP